MSNTASLFPAPTTDATMSQIHTIDASSISLLSENVGIVMESNIQKYASMNTEDLPTVRLGRVNEKVYAINHCDVVLGCMQSKKKVRCTIEQYENISDVMIQHFRDVMSNDVINTPLIYNSVDSLQERLKTDKLSVLKILGIEKNQYTRLLNNTTNNISEAAISKLEGMVTELSKRKGLTAIQASMPIYMLEKISRISDVNQQLKLIQIIESDLQIINDTKFCWMTPEQIESILQLVRQDATRTENKREDSIVAEFVEMEDIGKTPEEKNQTSTASTAKSENTKETPKKNKSKQKGKPVSQKTRQIIDTIPNIVVIPDEMGQPDYLVDKKNGTVTKVDSKATKGIIKTEQVPSKRLYSIPMDVSKFLGMGNGDGDSSNSSISTIRHKNISGIDSLKSFVESQKDPTQRYSIFWNE